MKEDEIRNEFEKIKKETTQEDLKKTLENENKIKEKSKKGALANLREDIELFFNIIKDYWNGDYRDVSWGTIASIVAALTYILSPIDIIPDIVPVIGLIDDAAVVALCLRLIHTDLEKYKKFKANKEKLKQKIAEGM